MQLQKTDILRKRAQKLKNHLHLNFLTTFHKTFTYHDYNITPKKKQLIYGLISDNVHLGIKPPQKHHPIFLLSALLNLQTVQALHF